MRFYITSLVNYTYQEYILISTYVLDQA